MKTFKLILGIVEMCFLPALIIIRYGVGIQLGIIHWLIAGAFFGLGIENIRKATNPKMAEKKKPKKSVQVKVKENEKQETGYQFLVSSYTNWRAGCFDSISDYYKTAASDDSPESLAAIMYNERDYKAYLDKCLKLRVPEVDEFLFTISPNDFLLTNKFLYINTVRKNGHSHVIPICDIEAYTNKGMWMKKGNLKLTNGASIDVKLEAVPDEKKLKQLQELLNCKQVIAI